MNPVLLKPQSEIGSQVVVQGRVRGTPGAGNYQAWKPRLMPAVLDSFARLGREADLVVVEGAGSPRRSTCARRHRQHGVRARRRRAGGARRRHRPRRRHRADRRHAGGDRPGRRGDDRRLPGQQVPRRPGAVRRRHRRSSRGARAGRPRPRPVLPDAHACRPRMRWRSPADRRAATGRCAIAVPDPAAASPISTTSIRCGSNRRSSSSWCARHAAAADAASSCCPDRRRRSPISPPSRRGLGHRHPGPCRRGGARAGPVRRLPDARPPHRRPARHRGAARQRRRARLPRRRARILAATSASRQ